MFPDLNGIFFRTVRSQEKKAGADVCSIYTLTPVLEQFPQFELKLLSIFGKRMDLRRYTYSHISMAHKCKQLGENAFRVGFGWEPLVVSDVPQFFFSVHVFFSM